MMKRLIFSFTLLGMTLCYSEETRSSTENDHDNVWFTGVVAPAKTATLAFGHFGKIESMKPVGYITNRYIAEHGDSPKDIIVKGDIVAQQDTTLYENKLKIAEADVRQAEAYLKDTLAHFKRCARLAEKQAISQKSLDDAELAYKKSNERLNTAQAELASAKYNLERCFLRAPFSGQVEEKYRSVGSWVGPGDDVLKITLVSLVRVKIAVPRKLCRNISITDSILVYPPGKEEPLGVWFDTLVYPSGGDEPIGKSFESFTPDKDHIDVFVANKLVPIKALTPAQEKLTKIDQIVFASRLNAENADAPLWAPMSSLRQDKAGNYFVWRAVGQKMAQPENPLEREFSVERVNIVPGDEFRDFGVYKYIKLKDPGKLEALDVVVPETNEPLKEGQRVVVEELQWMLSTGDRVRVKIPNAPTLMAMD